MHNLTIKVMLIKDSVTPAMQECSHSLDLQKVDLWRILLIFSPFNPWIFGLLRVTDSGLCQF